MATSSTPTGRLWSCVKNRSSHRPGVHLPQSPPPTIAAQLNQGRLYSSLFCFFPLSFSLPVQRRYWAPPRPWRTSGWCVCWTCVCWAKTGWRSSALKFTAQQTSALLCKASPCCTVLASVISACRFSQQRDANTLRTPDFHRGFCFVCVQIMMCS